MNNTKEKIRAMINEEKAAKRREELEESRRKKSGRKGKKEKGDKVKKERTPLNKDKKQLLRSLFFIILFILFALGLFYGASVSKKSVEQEYQQQLETKAKKQLEVLMTQSVQALSQKINNLNYVLKDAEYIKNFNKPAWQSILKTELAALLGDQAVIEVVPENFNDDRILDNPDMGYAVLSLLNELKSASNGHSDSHLKIEVHRANSKSARLMLVRKVTFKDADLQKEKAIGYIIASLSPNVIKELLNDFNSQDGYVEIVQKFSGKSSVLAKKGDASLKSLPLVITEKLNKTQWLFKYWPAEQRNEQPATLFWQSLVYLILGSLAFVSAMVLLVMVVNKYRKALYIAVPKRKQTNLVTEISDKHGAENVPVSAEVTDVLFTNSDSISVEEDNVTDKIFKAYDIRGVVGEFINADIFQKIAYAIAKEMNEIRQTKVAIACDGRNSSPELFQVLRKTLLESGIDVIDIGMVTSPVLYFAAITKADGNGVMVTASHNPANYNGMKIMLAGHSYSQDRLQKLKQRMLNQERVTKEGNAAGQLSELNVMEDYFTKIMGNVILARPLNIVIDTANGVTGNFATAFFEQLGCKVTALNEDVDGNFPAHEPDPSRPENMSELIQKVSELKADVGIAFDGDGDRIGLVSSGGEIIWPDRILMLLAKDILSRNEDATILYDVKSSGKLENFIRKLGGQPMMCQSGHSFMKGKLLETGALLAGEMSGHIFIKERWFGFDDALFVAARVLEILSIDLRKSRQVFAELPDSLNTPEILIAANDVKGIMAAIERDANNGQFNDGKIINIDGIRVEYPDGWGLVRGSNTTDNLTMRFEADNEEALQRIASTFKSAILAAAPDLEFPF